MPKKSPFGHNWAFGHIRSRGAVEIKAMDMTPHEQYITLAGGKITCPRCQAMSKRTKHQCGSPAMHGKRVCRIHGGKSTGPKSDAGRQRCATAKTTNGWETRAIRAERRQKLAELKEWDKVLGIS